ncbi:MAG: prolyl oligopeptidase family serine peptidase [Bryobacteraceae bacterium]
MKHLVLALLALGAFAAEGYKKPPKAIQDILDAPAPPIASVNPTHTHALFIEARRYPPIAELARPVLRLAGFRIDPASNGPQTGWTGWRLTLSALAADAKPLKLAVPESAVLSPPRWSPDGKRFALLNRAASSVELWVGDAATGAIRRLPNIAINAAVGEPLQWLPGSQELLAQLVPARRGPPPAEPTAPTGPVVQETSGKAGPVRTYQDLLASPYDEALFDYYATAQLAAVNASTGASRPIGAPHVFLGAEPAPDGRHLLVEFVRKPYSYLLTAFSFPRDAEVWTLRGTLVKKVASLPMADRVPIDGVRTGPRNLGWDPSAPATIEWVEALDGGNPKEKVPHRDRIMTWQAPFAGEASEAVLVPERLRGLAHGENGMRWYADYERSKRWLRTFIQTKGGEPAELFSLSSQDRYHDPGTPVRKTLPSGQRVILTAGNAIFLTGDGASPEGDRPFLDRFDLATRKTTRIFHCDPERYETVASVLDDQGARLLIRGESPTDPPNYYLLANGRRTQLTFAKDPAPELRTIHKELVTYKRADGVGLSFTLYLPPGHKEGTRLPTIVWAYPREFGDASVAAQVSGSTKRFTTIAGASHLFLLLAGYAILDGATMPVIGTPETANNTYIEQVVSSAKAAIDKAAAMGVTDPDRVGVGGHSYGAFMTANLLAHSDLFRAGVARSGAYNRTLTPFGFQAEPRTFWEAPEIYLKMSPFMHAQKLKEPILFIHGMADNNPGTFPIQSERMYQAIRGNGGTARFVYLPHESHGYSGRESIETTLTETIEWFDKHVKNAAPRESGPAALEPFAANAGFVEPFGIAFDSKNNAYVVEYKGNRLHRIAPDGTATIFAGSREAGFAGDGGPARDARFHEPHGIVISPRDELYVADTHNNRVRRIDLNTGIITTIAGNGEAGFSGDAGPATSATFKGIFGIDLDAARNRLYIADLGNIRVRMVDLGTGTVATVAGNGRSAEPADGDAAATAPLVDPRAIAVARTGEFYILERRGNALRVVGSDGRIRTLIRPGQFQPDLKGPKHLTVERNGDVLIADAENHLVRRYSPRSGTLTTIAGSGVPGPLNRPHGVYARASGAVYVADSYNHRIVRLR